MDHRPIELEEVLDLAFRRAYGDFQDKRVATAIAIQVARQYMATWQMVTDKWRVAPGHPAPKETVHSTNPAYYLDYLISAATKKRKDELLEAHLNDRQALSEVDLWLFFIEDLSRYAKMNKSPYMATATLMVLCDYANRSVLELYRYLHKERYPSKAEDPTEASASVFSRHKLNTFIPYLTSIYGPFVELEEVEKGKKQFVKAAMTPEALAMLTAWLELLTPLYPDCFLPETFDPYEVEKQYISYNSGDYVGAAERRRKHVMQCPKSLSRFLAAAKFQDWTNTFASPKMTPRGPDSGDKPSLDRFSLRKFPEDLVSFVKEALGTDEIRRQGLSQRTLFLAVDNGRPRRVRPGRKVRLRLKDGDGAIFVSGRDFKGFLNRELLLLDTHLVFWGEELADEESVCYVTNLRDGRKLELTLTYQKDVRGAVAEVTYYPSPKQEPVWRPALETVRQLVPKLAFAAAAAALLYVLPYRSLTPIVRRLLRPEESSVAGNSPTVVTLSTLGASQQSSRQSATTATPSPAPIPSILETEAKSETNETAALKSQPDGGYTAAPPALETAAAKFAGSRLPPSGATQHSERTPKQKTNRRKGANVTPRDVRPSRTHEIAATAMTWRDEVGRLSKRAGLFNCATYKDPSADSAEQKDKGSSPSSPHGQAAPIITGQVRASGVRLPGTSVTAIDIQSYKVKTTRTRKKGRFSFPNLIPGNYAIVAKRPGFIPEIKGIFEVDKDVGIIVSFDLKRRLSERRSSVSPKLHTNSRGELISAHNANHGGTARPSTLNSGNPPACLRLGNKFLHASGSGGTPARPGASVTTLRVTQPPPFALSRPPAARVQESPTPTPTPVGHSLRE